MSSDEMTPAKWGMIGAAILIVVVAIGAVYHFTKGQSPSVKSTGMSKDEIMKSAMPTPVDTGGYQGGGDEVKDIKSRGAGAGANP